MTAIGTIISASAPADASVEPGAAPTASADAALFAALFASASAPAAAKAAIPSEPSASADPAQAPAEEIVAALTAGAQLATKGVSLRPPAMAPTLTLVIPLPAAPAVVSEASSELPQEDDSQIDAPKTKLAKADEASPAAIEAPANAPPPVAAPAPPPSEAAPVEPHVAAPIAEPDAPQQPIELAQPEVPIETRAAPATRLEPAQTTVRHDRPAARIQDEAKGAPVGDERRIDTPPQPTPAAPRETGEEDAPVLKRAPISKTPISEAPISEAPPSETPISETLMPQAPAREPPAPQPLTAPRAADRPVDTKSAPETAAPQAKPQPTDDEADLLEPQDKPPQNETDATPPAPLAAPHVELAPAQTVAPAPTGAPEAAPERGPQTNDAPAPRSPMADARVVAAAPELRMTAPNATRPADPARPAPALRAEETDEAPEDMPVAAAPIVLEDGAAQTLHAPPRAASRMDSPPRAIATRAETNVADNASPVPAKSDVEPIRALLRAGVRDIAVETSAIEKPMDSTPQQAPPAPTEQPRSATPQAAVAGPTESASPERRAQIAEIRYRALERQIVSAARDGAETVRMQLYPPGLGQIVIRLAMDGKTLRLTTQASTEEAAQALREAEGGLRDALAGGGFQLAQFDVSDEGGDSGQRDRREPRDAFIPAESKSEDFAIDMNA